MAKITPQTQNPFSIEGYEESIKNYGSKIEHIESFVEAVQKFPGKPKVLPGVSVMVRNNPLLIAGKS